MELSKLLIREKRTQDAIAHLWPAVKATPVEVSAPLRFQLAIALSLQGQHSPAEHLLVQVVELEPSFVEAWICLANCYVAQGKGSDAEVTLERVVTGNLGGSAAEAAGETASRPAAVSPEVSAWCQRQLDALRQERSP